MTTQDPFNLKRFLVAQENDYADALHEIIDLAGFPKDVYYLYQSEWTDKEVLHLFPHWNWEDGQEIDMWCYYNDADEVELFVNGVSQGIRSKTEDCRRLSACLPWP